MTGVDGSWGQTATIDPLWPDQSCQVDFLGRGGDLEKLGVVVPSWDLDPPFPLRLSRGARRPFAIPVSYSLLTGV